MKEGVLFVVFNLLTPIHIYDFFFILSILFNINVTQRDKGELDESFNRGSC